MTSACRSVQNGTVLDLGGAGFALGWDVSGRTGSGFAGAVVGAGDDGTAGAGLTVVLAFALEALSFFSFFSFLCSNASL